MVRPMKNTELDNWFENVGARFAETLGIRDKYRVLDYGCGIGSYTVPLAQVVGVGGAVLALDRNGRNLRHAQRLATRHGVGDRVLFVLTAGEPAVHGVLTGYLDAVLLFDVLQHVDDWNTLVGDCRRALKSAGRVHVNPSFLSHPGKVDVDRLTNVMRQYGLVCIARRTARIMHYKHMAEDEIFTFAVKRNSRTPMSA